MATLVGIPPPRQSLEYFKISADRKEMRSTPKSKIGSFSGFSRTYEYAFSETDITFDETSLKKKIKIPVNAPAAAETRVQGMIIFFI